MPAPQSRSCFVGHVFRLSQRLMWKISSPAGRRRYNIASRLITWSSHDDLLWERHLACPSEPLGPRIPFQRSQPTTEPRPARSIHELSTTADDASAPIVAMSFAMFFAFLAVFAFALRWPRVRCLC